MNSRSIHPIARWTLSLGLRRGRHLELSRCKSERPSFLGPVAPRRIICLDGTTAVPGSENTWSPGHPSRKPGLSLSPSSSHFQSSPNLATQPFNYFLTLFFLPHPHFSSPNSGHHRLLQGQFNSCLMGFSALVFVPFYSAVSPAVSCHRVAPWDHSASWGLTPVHSSQLICSFSLHILHPSQSLVLCTLPHLQTFAHGLPSAWLTLLLASHHLPFRVASSRKPFLNPTGWLGFSSLLLCLSELISVTLNHLLTYLSPLEGYKIFVDRDLIFAVLTST